MVGCIISTCKNYSRVTHNTSTRYFRFPRDENIAKQWIKASNQKGKINIKNSRVCSVHFTPDCFQIPLIQQLLNYRTKQCRILKPDAVPTLKLTKEIPLHDHTYCKIKTRPTLSPSKCIQNVQMRMADT